MSEAEGRIGLMMGEQEEESKEQNSSKREEDERSVCSFSESRSFMTEALDHNKLKPILSVRQVLYLNDLLCKTGLPWRFEDPNPRGITGRKKGRPPLNKNREAFKPPVTPPRSNQKKKVGRGGGGGGTEADVTPKGEGGESSTRKRKRCDDDRRHYALAPPLEKQRVKEDGTKLELIFSRAHSLMECKRASSFSVDEDGEAGEETSKGRGRGRGRKKNKSFGGGGDWGEEAAYHSPYKPRLASNKPSRHNLPLRTRSQQHAGEEVCGMMGEHGEAVVIGFPNQNHAGCERVVQFLIGLESSIEFREPVDLERYPEYTRKIAKPMDLGTVESKLRGGVYKEVHSFEQDLSLIWQNAKKFNVKGSIIYNQAVALESVTRNLMEEEFGLFTSKDALSHTYRVASLYDPIDESLFSSHVRLWRSVERLREMHSDGEIETVSLPSGLSDISEQDSLHLRKADEVEALLGREDVREEHQGFLEEFIGSRAERRALWEEGDFIVNNLKAEQLDELWRRLSGREGSN